MANPSDQELTDHLPRLLGATANYVLLIHYDNGEVKVITTLRRKDLLNCLESHATLVRRDKSSGRRAKGSLSQ